MVSSDNIFWDGKFLWLHQLPHSCKLSFSNVGLDKFLLTPLGVVQFSGSSIDTDQSRQIKTFKFSLFALLLWELSEDVLVPFSSTSILLLILLEEEFWLPNILRFLSALFSASLLVPFHSGSHILDLANTRTQLLTELLDKNIKLHHTKIRIWKIIEDGAHQAKLKAKSSWTPLPLTTGPLPLNLKTMLSTVTFISSTFHLKSFFYTYLSTTSFSYHLMELTYQLDFSHQVLLWVSVMEILPLLYWLIRITLEWKLIMFWNVNWCVLDAAELLVPTLDWSTLSVLFF